MSSDQRLYDLEYELKIATKWTRFSSLLSLSAVLIAIFAIIFNFHSLNMYQGNKLQHYEAVRELQEELVDLRLLVERIDEKVTVLD